MKKIVLVTVRVLTAPKPEQFEISSGRTLKALQSVVGGYIETAARKASEVRPGIELDAYCNEEGRLIGLPENRLIDGQPIAGDVVISAADPSTGETVEMDEALVLEAIKWARSWPMAIAEIPIRRGAVH